MGKGVCFTGHRPEKLMPNYIENSKEIDSIKYQLYSQIEKAVFEGFDTFYTGMARGIDIYAAEIVTEFRATNSIKLMAIIPFYGQHKQWSPDWQSRYEHILRCCDSAITLSDKYFAGCMHERNAFMVENSSRVIAVYNGSAGGTHNTIKLAQKQGKEIVYIKL